MTIASANNNHERFSALNVEQLEAVNTTEGPLLVLAGAGTGKTLVLTSRIANIISSNRALPWQILAMTFTNKAAREMKQRVENLVGEASSGLWLGTFHAIAAKILRKHAEYVGLTSNFIIIDYADQLKLAKKILADFNLDEKQHPAKLMLYIIERFKDKARLPEHISQSETTHFASGNIVRLYTEYQARLKQLNAVDFSDLLLLNINLFNNNPEIYEQYLNKFRYILVDEYQDTNVAQYIWLRLLAQGSRNICCVGDDDQSIYGWRGAEVTNILKFDKDFDGAKIIRLERNYRSTNHIIAAATALIAYNQDRHGKKLWTDHTDGNKIKIYNLYDDKREARFIAEEIECLQRKYNMRLSDIAILVRAGYQTRNFEESLNFFRIPYRVVGSMKFYERIEIKDVLAYIRVLVNDNDALAFERIINVPRRGVGNTTLQQIILHHRQHNISFAAAIADLIKLNKIKGKLGSVMTELLTQLDKYRLLIQNNAQYWNIIEEFLQETGYIQLWKNEGTDEAKDRLDNIKELLKTLQDYQDLRSYLEHVSLISDNDDAQEQDKVSVMTIHAAKGLEFDTVFLPGWEEGIFPSQKALDEKGKSALEEERRLAYVAITRTKKTLYICHASNRRLYGSYQSSIPSKFIEELPEQNYERINDFNSYYSGNYNGFGQRFTSDKAKSYVNPDMGVYAGNKTIRVGSSVMHKTFGAGVIISLNDNAAEVAFHKTGVKRVMLDYLQLT